MPVVTIRSDDPCMHHHQVLDCRACVIAARTLGRSYDALGPLAGAAIAVLEGRCAREGLDA